MRRKLVSLVGAVLIVSALLVGSTPATAEGHLDVVVEGLDNPRGLDVKGHRIYVAEAGRGGPTLVDAPQGGGPGPVCVGTTGSISQIVDGVAVTRVELPSIADAVGGECGGPGFGFAATGPHGVAIQGRQLHYTVGLGANPASRALMSAVDPTAALLGTVTDQRGNRTFLRDLAEFEDVNDPAGDGSDSNPYGVVRGPSATALVVDAGGNSLIEVRRSSTTVKAVFAPRCVPFLLGPNPIPPALNPCGEQTLFPAQSVPTAVAFHDDGDYLVTTLGGFPFPPGQSVIYKIDADHPGVATCSASFLAPADGCEIFADGLTALVGIDVDQTGKVYAVQLSDDGIMALGGPGSVQVFDGDTGAPVGSIGGLTAPGGISISKGEVYLTNNSISPGAGQIVKTGLIH